MAQQVEHVLGKDEVTGSNPVSSSIYGTVKKRQCLFFALLTVIEIVTLTMFAIPSCGMRTPYKSG